MTTPVEQPSPDDSFDPQEVGAGIDYTDPNSALAWLYLRTSHILFAGMLVFVFLFYGVFTPLGHTDIWGHLKYGEWIVNQRALPEKELFSAFSDQEQPYWNFQWLSQTLFYLAYHAGELLVKGDELRQAAGGVEMRPLTWASLPERGAVVGPGCVGIGRGSITGRADLRDAEDICHQQRRGGEATSGQPIPRVQNFLELVEAVPHPASKTVVLRAGYFEEPPGNGHHLDRVERGDHPLNGVRFSDRIARHQCFALPSQMQQPGAALEYFQLAITQERNLAEGLARQVIGLPSVERNRSY